jgi:chemotaxis protein methyltransferase CheR
MPPGTNITISTREFELFRALVYEETGISLHDHKRLLLNNRLTKRLRHYGFGSFMEYYQLVRGGGAAGGEIQELINAVTTNKTEFFRESHHFDMLTELLLVPVAKSTAAGSRPHLRIWSAGCSTGEEPYSIAITMAMNLERLAAWDIKILASDIDTSVLARAGAAIYSRESVRGLSPEILKRHFLSGVGEHADYVQVTPEIRNLINFSQINLMKAPWPFRTKLDAIFCRNVIIYFDKETQRRLVEGFVRTLKPGGLFFAGHSENLFWLGDLLEPIGQTVYRMRGGPGTSDAQPAGKWPVATPRGRS